jgi:hypothetical protein
MKSAQTGLARDSAGLQCGALGRQSSFKAYAGILISAER